MASHTHGTMCVPHCQCSRTGPWVTLTDCVTSPTMRTMATASMSAAAGKNYLFRLYFVDAPETALEFGERVNEQAKYFGVTLPQTFKWEQRRRVSCARNFPIPLSCERACRTRWVGAKWNASMPSLKSIITTWAKNWLQTAWPEFHGTDTRPPGMSRSGNGMAETRPTGAHGEGTKGWRMGRERGRLNTRVVKARNNTPCDSFDAFFHPERLHPTPTPPATAGPEFLGTSSGVS